MLLFLAASLVGGMLVATPRLAPPATSSPFLRPALPCVVDADCDLPLQCCASLFSPTDYCCYKGGRLIPLPLPVRNRTYPLPAGA